MRAFVKEHGDEVEHRLCEFDFPRFANTVGRLLIESLGETFCPYNDFHWEMAKLTDLDRAVVLAPRDHNKSTILSQLYPLWLATYQPGGVKINSLLVSDTSKQAKRNLEHIDMLIDAVPWLRFLKPKNPELWSKTRVKMTNGSSIEVVGFGSPIRGAHFHLVILDDLIGDTQRFSFSFMDRFLKRAIIPMVKPGCKLFFVGTPQHELDPLMQAFNSGIYHAVQYKAVIDWDTCEVLWPERWPWDLLMQRREEMGSTAFAQEYQCEPVDDTSSMFPWDILEKCFAQQMQLRRAAPEKPLWPVYAGVDVARSGKVGADFFVIIVAEVDDGGNRNLLEIVREKGLGLTAQIKRLRDVYTRQGFQVAMIEKSGLDSLSEIASEYTDMPIKSHTTGREKKAFDEGVPSLVVMFENEKYRIPRQRESDRITTDILINELRHFGWEGGTVKGKGSKDDCVMALWMLELAIRSSPRRVRTFGLR